MSRYLRLASFGIFMFVLILCPSYAQTNTSWVFTNGDGNWSDSSNWTNGVPNGNYNATINTLNSAFVTLDINATVVNLNYGPSVKQNDGLFIAGKKLTVTNSLIASDALGLGNGSVLNVHNKLMVEAGCSDCPSEIVAGGSKIKVGSSFELDNLFSANFGATKVQVGRNFISLGDRSAVFITAGSRFIVGGNFINDGASYMYFSGASKAIVDGNLINAGISSLSLTDGSTIKVYGTVTNNSSAALSDSQFSLRIDPSSKLTTYSGFYQSGAETLSLVAGTLNAFGSGVHIQNGLFSNTGVINGNLILQGGNFSNAGRLNGNFDVQGGNFQNDGKVSGNSLIQGGAVSNTGTINGNLKLQNGSFVNNGKLNGSSDIQGGVLSGTGIFNGNVSNGGMILSGVAGAPGTLTIRGNYEQTSLGLLNELIGPGSNSFLNVKGAVGLDPGATLDITLLGGFDPVGDKFDIMGFNSLTGEFSNGMNFTADGYNWNLSYGGHDMVLTAESPVATPEPSSLALLAVGLCLLGVGMRRTII